MSKRSGGGSRDAEVDRLVRARIAEIMSAAGVDTGRIGLEVLWDMPPGFVRAYEWLWRLIAEGERALGEARNDAEVGVANDVAAGRMGGGAQGRTRDTEKTRATNAVVVVRSGGSARRGARGASHGSSGLGVAGPGLEDVARLKERIDKRLRQAGREIAEEIKEVMGLDIETGGEVVKVDMAGLVALRRAIAVAANDDAIDD